jgi:hypothetical protein
LSEKILELESAIEAQRQRLLPKTPNSNNKEGYLRGLVVHAELIGPDARQVVSTVRGHKSEAETETETPGVE